MRAGMRVKCGDIDCMELSHTHRAFARFTKCMKSDDEPDKCPKQLDANFALADARKFQHFAASIEYSCLPGPAQSMLLLLLTLFDKS
jgi:hypothetical protein